MLDRALQHVPAYRSAVPRRQFYAEIKDAVSGWEAYGGRMGGCHVSADANQRDHQGADARGATFLMGCSSPRALARRTVRSVPWAHIHGALAVCATLRRTLWSTFSGVTRNPSTWRTCYRSASGRRTCRWGRDSAGASLGVSGCGDGRYKRIFQSKVKGTARGLAWVCAVGTWHDCSRTELHDHCNTRG